MSIIQAVIYGMIQGITGFLPVSSTAHLIMIPWLLGWPEPGTAFDVALHFGTAAAVIVFFFKDWMRLIAAGVRNPKSTDGKLFWFIMIATVPGAIVGVLLEKYMDNFKDPLIISVILIIMGIVLYLADKFGRHEADLAQIGLKRSVLIGLSQAVAIIPGVSRSSSTMAAGRALGVTRDGIARFVFLLATPLILGDTIYHARDMITVSISIVPLITAVLTATVVGIFSIKFLLVFLKKRGFGIFALYRMVFGAAIIAVYFIRN